MFSALPRPSQEKTRRCNGPVNVQPGNGLIHRMYGEGFKLKRKRRFFRAARDESNLVFLKQRGDFTTKGGSGIFLLWRNRFHRDHDLAFDLNQWTGQHVCNMGSPLLLETKITPVCNHHGRFFSKLGQIWSLFVPLVVNDHFDPRLLKAFLRFLQAFQHEGVMPEVGLGKIIDQFKIDQYWKVSLIGLPYGNFQCMIVCDSLRGLHPIDDVVSLFGRIFI